MKTHAEEAFEKFVISGYDPESVAVDDLYAVIQTWVYSELVPVTNGSYGDLIIRSNQWASKLAQLAARIQSELWQTRNKLQRQREQLIEAKKEISRLKRNNKV